MHRVICFWMSGRFCAKSCCKRLKVKLLRVNRTHLDWLQSFSARSSYHHLLAWRSPRSAKALLLAATFFWWILFQFFNFNQELNCQQRKRRWFDDPNQPTYVPLQDSQSWHPNHRFSGSSLSSPGRICGAALYIGGLWSEIKPADLDLMRSPKLCLQCF